MKMKLVEVLKKDFPKMVNDFYNESMFTFEGLNVKDEEGMKLLAKHVLNAGYTGKELIGFWFTGELMNEHFKLTESNKYPDDLMFLVIPNFYNPEYKLLVGARWFDDIVSNNTIRQNAIDHNTDPDYGMEVNVEEEAAV